MPASPRRAPGDIARAVQRASIHLAVALQSGPPSAAVTPAEAGLLAFLAAAGPITPTQLRRDFGHRPSTLTSVLGRLEARGFVTRHVSPADRRSLRVELTQRGTVAARRAARRLADVERRVRGDVSARDLERFFAVLDAIDSATVKRSSR